VNSYSILFVEDDIHLGYILKEYLQLHGFSVTWVKDGQEGLACTERQNFHLLILDVMMPRIDGFELARIIREKKDLPVIFLTAKALLVDKLKGFKAGADDYIVKPVEEEELIARIRVILKRYYPAAGAEADNNSIFEIGYYRFDFRNQKLLFNGQEIMITAKEADLLRMLCLNKDQVLDRKEALGKLWNVVDYFSRRNMDVFITRLRKHLARDPRIRIVNIHGKGFMLRVEE
jgi:DNA-binding response OmpR family regulator